MDAIAGAGSSSPIWPSQEPQDNSLKKYNQHIWNLLNELVLLCKQLGANPYIDHLDPNLASFANQIKTLFDQLAASPQPPAIPLCETLITKIQSFLDEADVTIEQLGKQQPPIPMNVLTDLMNMSDGILNSMFNFNHWVNQGEPPE